MYKSHVPQSQNDIKGTAGALPPSRSPAKPGAHAGLQPLVLSRLSRAVASAGPAAPVRLALSFGSLWTWQSWAGVGAGFGPAVGAPSGSVPGGGVAGSWVHVTLEGVPQLPSLWFLPG